MTMLETSLYEVLTTGAQISALVGDRMYPTRLPQGATLPALTYSRVSSVRQYTHSGPSGLDDARIQVTCWDTTYDGAKALATAVRQDLEAAGYRHQNEVDLDEPDTETYLTVLDFKIGHRD